MTRSTYEKRERNERHPRDGEETKRGGIKGMDGWKCGLDPRRGIDLCIRGRSSNTR